MSLLGGMTTLMMDAAVLVAASSADTDPLQARSPQLLVFIPELLPRISFRFSALTASNYPSTTSLTAILGGSVDHDANLAIMVGGLHETFDTL